MSELQRLRDEIAQLQTALTIKNGTIEQLKARVAELETLIAEVKGAYQNAIHWEDMRPTLKRIDSALFEKPSVLKDRNVTYSTSTQQTTARQVPDGWRELMWRASNILGSQGFEAWNKIAAEIDAILAAAPQAEKAEAVGAIYSSISGTCERLARARREAGYSMGATEDDLLRMASGFRRHAEQQGGDS